jgi:hypothetical protein
MRLGQLARKVAVHPSEIVSFLSKHNITVEDTTNARVDDEHVKLVYEKFAPHLANVVVEEMPEREAIPEVQPVEADTKEETLVSTPVTELSEEVAAESPAELPEVIKAPKVELKGLTVLGKIDLPTPKPKENAPAATVTEPSAEPLTEKPVESPVGKQNRPRRGEKPRESQRQERAGAT